MAAFIPRLMCACALQKIRAGLLTDGWAEIVGAAAGLCAAAPPLPLVGMRQRKLFGSDCFAALLGSEAFDAFQERSLNWLGKPEAAAKAAHPSN